MKPVVYKWVTGMLLSLMFFFQYSCNETKPVEQITDSKHPSKLSLPTPISGAIFTTDNTCTGVNLNIYQLKTDVYLDGGPSHPGAAGLPDGYYYCCNA